MEKIWTREGITIGTCYYPEHWDRNLWEEDLERIKAAGITVIRIAEFAWNLIEPKEGEFDDSFFDGFLELCDKHGMQVIFGTPSATPPVWMTEKYPEVLNADINGHIYRHGLRRHNNLTSPKYLYFVERIVEHIVKHYSHFECIIGWQIDNEVNCEINEYYSESDHNAFREYLKDKYKTLDELNEKLGLVFWNQTYTDWSEVHLSRTTPNGRHNPHVKLEEKRFISQAAIKFIKLQADIIRKYKRDNQFVTTNGMFGNVDNHELAEEALDFMTYDSYPDFAFGLGARPREKNSHRDRCGSVRLAETESVSPIFGVMEQQSGHGGWTDSMLQPNPKPGQLRLWAFQSVAHGADYISFFRWRTANFGKEMYWEGILGHSNKDNRRVSEVKQFADDIAKIQEISKQRVAAKVGLVRDYDNEWDGVEDVWHGRVRNYSTGEIINALHRNHIPFKFVNLNDRTQKEQLEDFELLVYPHPTIITEKRAELLEGYVENGGKLLIGAFSGNKDIYGRYYMAEAPGYLSDLLGISVEEGTLLGTDDDEEFVLLRDKTRIKAPLHNDILVSGSDTAEVLGSFEGNFYTGRPAFTGNSFGKGKAYYFGAAFEEEAFKTILDIIGYKDSISECTEMPETVELCVRGSQKEVYYFLLNYDKEKAVVKLKADFCDMLTATELAAGAEITLDGYGVAILKRR